ncbi:MAG: type II toxin-antitoxin system HigB family toxin, partial [Candidatus Omnitrophica bacterium]|nr:type II toxin-antitoxin system HigB family toxin [Candidatus Omnitrophota bacterium]
ANSFKHLNELKQTFGSADYVRPYTVFNISGNKYRLITLVNYQIRTVFVEQILTHREYDRGKWRK